MSLGRRSLLVLLGSSLTGCLAESEEPPRRIVSLEETTTTSTPTPPPDPEIVSQTYVRGPDGNVRITANLSNPREERVYGTLFAEIEHNGTANRYERAFTVGSTAHNRVNVSTEIDYEAFREQPNLVLTITMDDETDSSPSS